jgi:hypothetical protein
MGDPAKAFFKNPSYGGQLVRTLAAATVGSADTFRQAVILMGHPAEPVRIPYENTSPAGYLHRTRL